MSRKTELAKRLKRKRDKAAKQIVGGLTDAQKQHLAELLAKAVQDAVSDTVTSETAGQ